MDSFTSNIVSIAVPMRSLGHVQSGVQSGWGRFSASGKFCFVTMFDIVWCRAPPSILHRGERVTPSLKLSTQGCILAGISFLSISSILLPTRKSGIRRDKYLSAAIFKEAVHSDDS